MTTETTLADVKQAVEDQNQLIADFRKEVDDLKGKNDPLSSEKLEKMSVDIVELTKSRDSLTQDLETAQKLAEEASLKAGRQTPGDAKSENPAEVEHKGKFLDFLRSRGTTDAEIQAKSLEVELGLKALGSADGSGAGVAVPRVIASEINSKGANVSVYDQLVNVVEIGTSDYSEIIDKGGAAFGWVGAGDTRSGTARPDVFSAEPKMGTIYSYPTIQEEQLDDVFFDVEKWLIDNTFEAHGNGIDAAIFAGDGVKKPLGMLSSAPVAAADGSRTAGVYQFIASGAAEGIGNNADQLIKLVYAVKAKYRPGAKFTMNSLTTVSLLTLKDGDGLYIWQPSIAAGQPDRLLGYVATTTENMPDIAANSTPIGFGDHKKAYTAVVRHGMRITKDEITAPGFVKWHIRRRVGGTPTNDDAVKFYKISA